MKSSLQVVVEESAEQRDQDNLNFIKGSQRTGGKTKNISEYNDIQQKLLEAKRETKRLQKTFERLQKEVNDKNKETSAGEVRSSRQFQAPIPSVQVVNPNHAYRNGWGELSATNDQRLARNAQLNAR